MLLRLALLFAALTGGSLVIAIACYITHFDAAALIAAILAGIYFVFMEASVHFHRKARGEG